MPSHYDRDLRISLVLPEHWEVGSTPDFPLFLVAPQQQGFRSNLGFSRSEMPPDPDVVTRMVEAARREQAAEYPGFNELSARELEIDSCPTFLQIYAWRPDGAAQPFRQWFGLVRTPRHGLIELNGATLESLASSAGPAVEGILRSVRFVDV